MKVKHLIQLLNRCDPESEARSEGWYGSDDTHGCLRVWSRGNQVWIDRFTGKHDRDRDFYRTALTNGPEGMKSYIQTYSHLRAKTEEDAAGDLTASAITQVEHDEDIVPHSEALF